MTRLYCDLETYSDIPINCGTHRYAERAEVLLWAYAFDDADPVVWDVASGEPMPADLREALDDPDILTVWHNGAMFDLIVLRHALQIHLPPERVHDTMVQAYAHSLPGSLGDLCAILGVDTDKAKDKAGRDLIHLFCKPRPKTSKIARATRHTHPVEWERFKAYATSDILAMREIARKIPTWNLQGQELELWYLDQRINRRGFLVDVELAECAIQAVEREQERLAERTQDITGGAVQAATQRDALLVHLLAEYGVELPDMQKSTLERRISDPDLPIALRELLEIRLQASTTSTSKYKALTKAVSSDGRLRGTLQFCGASRTGRWAGRLFQPQNLARQSLPQDAIDLGIEAIKAGCADLITDNVMELTSNTVRGCIIAPRGKKLVVADLSNIEGRVLAWEAGENWKIKAFRDFDAGTGPDLYKLAYSKAFGVTPDAVTKDQRQIGKVMELALGYEGGVGAFLTFAAVYGIDLEAMGQNAIRVIPKDILAEARDALDWARKNNRPTFGLSDQAWIVCESFKRLWRYAHAHVTQFWREVGDSARSAIQGKGRTLKVRDLAIRRDGNWLRIRLPSGRCLCYPNPQVDNSGQISYMGVNQYSRKWQRLKTYSGKIVENITQAIARDVLASSMPAIEQAGYQIVLTVHDEVICEAPDSPEFNVEHLAGLMATTPPWAMDLPLAASGFETYRYRKE